MLTRSQGSIGSLLLSIAVAACNSDGDTDTDQSAQMASGAGADNASGGQSEVRSLKMEHLCAMGSESVFLAFETPEWFHSITCFRSTESWTCGGAMLTRAAFASGGLSATDLNAMTGLEVETFDESGATIAWGQFNKFEYDAVKRRVRFLVDRPAIGSFPAVKSTSSANCVSGSE